MMAAILVVGAEYRVRLDRVPDSCLGANIQRRTSHHRWAPAAQALRWTAAYAAREVADRRGDPAFPAPAPVQIDAVIAWPRRRHQVDFDNAVHMLKPAVDGITDAGWVENDRQVAGMTVRQTRDSEGNGWVELIVRAAGDIQDE